MKPEDQKVNAHQRLRRVLSALWLLMALFLGWKIFVDCRRVEGLGLKPIHGFFQVMPSLLLACSAGWVLRKRAKMYWALSLSLIAAAFLTMLVFFGNGMAATQSVTDPKQYHRALNDYWRSGAPDLVSNFPERIPAEAQNIHFLFTPRFLMGGARLYLLYRTSAEEIQRIRSVAEKSRKTACNLLGTIAGIP